LVDLCTASPSEQAELVAQVHLEELEAQVPALVLPLAKATLGRQVAVADRRSSVQQREARQAVQRSQSSVLVTHLLEAMEGCLEVEAQTQAQDQAVHLVSTTRRRSRPLGLQLDLGLGLLEVVAALPHQVLSQDLQELAELQLFRRG